MVIVTMYRLLMRFVSIIIFLLYLHPLDHELLQLIRRRPSVLQEEKCILIVKNLVTGKLQLGPFEVFCPSYTWP